METTKTLLIDGKELTATLELKLAKPRRAKKGRAYVLEGRETILENLENRRNRPVDLYGEILRACLEKKDLKMKWSQKAGCACGCSPGFILEDEFYGYDVFVELK